ncbi:class I SAM-dependent methyltransferase [Flavihumibacter profundi]|jgi:2-polyprenyl-3-methyl-5-hydroxy-6-metoxy-1,4-benzoquinol methylase|uniref:class I SAM-dependent methyltransferase n=1 Tax=Flavihumibacter profundi TaxID=2716883 RepID=UPI001CC5F70D|nr:class I SAM-dependent methyltransferase [Flavihumibacter profundi]MBZ5856540.1 class I SAM-dependent methyltransferase [Flavihumibacter profundi]
MSTGSWFQDWFSSPYYHQLYFKRDEAEADKFINKLIKHLKPAPGATMLDVACGRGRHARSLAAMGFDVTGIDISKDSIAEALLAENENLHFYKHDMRLPFRVNYFQYAFNFFTSFGYFRTEREHYNAIRTIAQSLSAGGTFVMDYLNVHYAEDHLVFKQDEQIDGVNYYITKWHDETHFYKKIIVEDEALGAPLEFMEKVAKFSLGDFNDMFSFHHLQIQEVFGDYDFGNYDVKKSPRLIMIARKQAT